MGRSAGDHAAQHTRCEVLCGVRFDLAERVPPFNDVPAGWFERGRHDEVGMAESSVSGLSFNVEVITRGHRNFAARARSVRADG